MALLELTDWFRDGTLPDRPWLVLGKGPTFERRSEFDVDAYNVLALNHVVNEMHVDVAHAIDVDVVADCAPHIAQNCDWLLMPRYPHVRSTPGDRALEDWFDEVPVLRELADDQRLVWYNLSHSPRVGRSPVIGATRFSSEAVLNILGSLGVTTVRSLGVDGGRTYAPSFSALEDSTLLANGALDFHLQFELLAVIAEERGIDFRPLVEPLRVFVDADESEVVAFRVLEYSIQRGASVPVEAEPLFDAVRRSALAGIARARWRSAIPELCGFHGRALYLDAATLVSGDVDELARVPFGEAAELAGAAGPDGGRPPVVLIDCERAVEGSATAHAAEPLPEGWDPATGGTKIVRLGGSAAPPWLGGDDPNAPAWFEIYREAVNAGAVPPEEVEDLIDSGSGSAALRPALRLAPSRRSAFTSAARDLNSAQRRVEALEQELAAIKSSTSWRLGRGLTRLLAAPRAAWDRVGRRRRQGDARFGRVQEHEN